MESEWTKNEKMDLNTHDEGPDPWKTPRRYHRRKGWDGNTLGSAQLVQTADKIHVP